VKDVQVRDEPLERLKKVIKEFICSGSGVQQAAFKKTKNTTFT